MGEVEAGGELPPVDAPLLIGGKIRAQPVRRTADVQGDAELRECSLGHGKGTVDVPVVVGYHAENGARAHAGRERAHAASLLNRPTSSSVTRSPSKRSAIVARAAA